LSELVELLKRAIKKLEEPRREELQAALTELKSIDISSAVQSGIAASGRGAIYQLRRAFYARLSRLVKEEGVNKERSVEEWRKTAGTLIDFMNEKGLDKVPCKVVLSYEVAEENGVKYLRFTRARIYYFGIEGVETLDFA